MNNLSILISGATENERTEMAEKIIKALEQDGFQSIYLRDMPLAANCASLVHPRIRYDVDLATLNTELDHYQLIYKSSHKKLQKA